jgi:2-polyprenyl-3-methyl-5-hydroxy-6-metoxy-1,4-benzoquinol methylase
MRDDAERWNQRYAATSAADACAPEALERWPDLTVLLPAEGRCIDIASGPGAVTLWLAARGLDVTALDASGVAIDVLESAATAAGLSNRIDARVIDLDDGLPQDLHDLDLIVCQRFRDTALYPTIIERLRPGGLAIITVLSTVGAREPGPFHAPEGELLQAFGSDPRCDIIHDLERDGVAHLVARRLP